jgi:uncharacterized membrane protein YoaK (UPF0700 family)
MASITRAALRIEQRLAATLAMTAGFVDAYGLISYQTYLSFMSGNTTQTGSQIGQWQLSRALPSAIAIVSFVIGVFAGALIVRSNLREPHRVLLAAVAVLIGFVIVVSTVRSLANLVGIAALALAMGIMNTSLSRVGAQAVNIGFVTGTLNRIADHLALAVKRVPLADAEGPWDTHVRRAMVLVGVWAAFLTGALLAGIATSRFGVRTLLFPVIVLVVLIVLNQSAQIDSDNAI